MASAFWTVAPGAGELRHEDLRPPGIDEALVAARYSGMSRGTEALVFAGRVPPSLAVDMRAPHQVGDFPFPVKFGYASVGVVEEGPPAWRGRRVFCLHPHQDRYVVPLGALRPVPDGVPDHRAALAANVETAVNAIWDGGVAVGDRVAVVGAGCVGLAVALLISGIPGVALQVVDVDPVRRALAARMGLVAVAPEAAHGEADRVFHASGQSEGLATALALAGFEATIVEQLSWYGAGDVPVPLGEAFHVRRLRLQSSQVGHVPAERRSRWSRARRLDLALSLLAEPRFDALVSSPEEATPLALLPERAAALLDGGGAPLPLISYLR